MCVTYIRLERSVRIYSKERTCSTTAQCHSKNFLACELHSANIHFLLFLNARDTQKANKTCFFFSLNYLYAKILRYISYAGFSYVLYIRLLFIAPHYVCVFRPLNQSSLYADALPLEKSITRCDKKVYVSLLQSCGSKAARTFS